MLKCSSPTPSYPYLYPYSLPIIIESPRTYGLPPPTVSSDLPTTITAIQEHAKANRYAPSRRDNKPNRGMYIYTIDIGNYRQTPKTLTLRIKA